MVAARVKSWNAELWDEWAWLMAPTNDLPEKEHREKLQTVYQKISVFIKRNGLVKDTRENLNLSDPRISDHLEHSVE